MKSQSEVAILQTVTGLVSTLKLAYTASTPDTNQHTADHSTSRLRTAMVAVASRTALEDALHVQTPTALAPRRRPDVPMCLPVDVVAALLLVETPTADVHLRQETGIKHPEAATATVLDLALRFL